MNKKIISLMLAAILLLAIIPQAGCAHKTPDDNVTPSSTDPAAETAPVSTDEATDNPTAEPTFSEPPLVTAEPEPAYEFNPHLYLPILASDIPQDHWDSFYNLCDALRAGETTFECSSEEAYKWMMDPVTLAQLCPAACLKIKGQTSDGSAPFENGVGKISYQIPAEEYVERQAKFEEMVEVVLNTYLEPDDDDFEKCLKLYKYMAYNYTYNYDFDDTLTDGYVYHTIMTRKGQCIDIASVYAFFLLQAGVEALMVGGSAPDMDHAWTYIIINGKGYHSDPTWALKSEGDDEPLLLYYFLMTAANRAETGFDMEEMTVSLLPKYWAKNSTADFSADSEEYCFPGCSFLISLDEENKIVHYERYGENFELSYAHD